MQPMIICAAITGGAKAKSRSAFHPSTPAEVADSAIEAWRAGAAMLHLHARMDDGDTTMDASVYRDLIRRIRDAGCDALLNLSAGDNGGRATHAERLAVADAGAEIVSLDAGPINIADRIYDNSPAYLREMSGLMQTRGIRPAIEVFDMGHLAGIHDLIKRGLLAAPYFIEFVFGVPGGLPLDERLLPILVEQLPADSLWAVSCQTSEADVFQQFQLWTFSHGGHIRTGLEDHVFLHAGKPAPSNAAMVRQWADTAGLWGRPIATPRQARAMLRLP